MVMTAMVITFVQSATTNHRQIMVAPKAEDHSGASTVTIPHAPSQAAHREEKCPHFRAPFAPNPEIRAVKLSSKRTTEDMFCHAINSSPAKIDAHTQSGCQKNVSKCLFWQETRTKITFAPIAVRVATWCAKSNSSGNQGASLLTWVANVASACFATEISVPRCALHSQTRIKFQCVPLTVDRAAEMLVEAGQRIEAVVPTLRVLPTLAFTVATPDTMPTTVRTDREEVLAS